MYGDPRKCDELHFLINPKAAEAEPSYRMEKKHIFNKMSDINDMKIYYWVLVNILRFDLYKW